MIAVVCCCAFGDQCADCAEKDHDTCRRRRLAENAWRYE